MRATLTGGVLIISITLSTLVMAIEPDTSLFKPLPKQVEQKDTVAVAQKVTLGKRLFLDTQLSENNSISCNSCHNLKTFGVDNEARSPGTKGQLGDRNSPSVYNSALHIAQFWDGRAKDVEEQALGPVLNPKEMAMPSEKVVLERLSSDPTYLEQFKAAFPNEAQPITFVNVGKAIGAFERTLLTPSRFDQYLEGDKSALTEQEKAGLQKFSETGCTACHNGVLLGANAYQKFGLVKPYVEANPEDHGRMAVTKNAAEDMFFKVPSLRNIEKTGPYFHDGSIATLDQAVDVMAEYQLGKKLSKEEITSIVTFLRSLTGKLPQ